jgi:RNA polymerase sigma-70 factor, ECF subfamily
MSKLGLQSNQAQEVAEIYRTQHQHLQRRCLRIVKDVSLADDALQQTFVRLLRYWDSYQQAPSRRFWLLRACDQVCFNLRRKQAQILLVEDARLDVEQVGSVSGGGGESGSDLDRRDLLDQLLGELDDVERHLLVCAHLDGMSKTEIALSTGWSRQTIHRKLRSICVTARRLEHRPRLARAA